MGTAYVEPAARARKISSTLRRVVQEGSQDAIAAAIGVSSSTVSRLLSEHLDHVAAIAAHAGLKLVSADKVCVPADTWEHHCRIVRRVYATEERAREFLEDEAE